MLKFKDHLGGGKQTHFSHMKFSGRPIRYSRTLDMFGKAIAFLQIPFGLGKSLPSFFVVCGFRTGLVSPLVNQNWQEIVPFFSISGGYSNMVSYSFSIEEPIH